MAKNRSLASAVTSTRVARLRLACFRQRTMWWVWASISVKYDEPTNP